MTEENRTKKKDGKKTQYKAHEGVNGSLTNLNKSDKENAEKALGDDEKRKKQGETDIPKMNDSSKAEIDSFKNSKLAELQHQQVDLH